MTSSNEKAPAAELSGRLKWRMAAGIFFTVLAIYVLTSPGRIDIIDGQARYDVAYHWLLEGRPLLSDPLIKDSMSVKGRSGLNYSYYGPAGSVFAMPLLWLGFLHDDPPGETSRFFFSLTSAVFGALIAVVVFLFYLELRVPLRKALAWTMLGAFATYIWPISNSSFDNAQHAFFVIAAFYLGFMSAERKSRLLAMTGGLTAGVLILYQEYFLLIIPALAISTLNWRDAKEPASGREQAGGAEHRGNPQGRQLIHAARTVLAWIRSAYQRPGVARESFLRFALFLVSTSAGGILSLAYNHLRFGSFLQNGKVVFAAQRGYPLLGNPVTGFLTLLVSPGKSIFLYSLPVILGLWGFRALWRLQPEIGAVLVGVTAMLVLFISCISFAGGDWCWGPRYLAPLIPCWALPFPFVSVKGRLQRKLMLAILAAGMLTQGLALSVENQRFFFERGLNDFFWAEDPWYYFRHSALYARVGEAVSLKDGLPPSARWFNSIPDAGWLTYTVLGPPKHIPRRQAPQWLTERKVFYLPKPWPLWMWRIKPDLRPINLEAWLGALLGMALLGLALILRSFPIITTAPSPDEGVLAQRLGID